ncbi:Aldehyde oxidase/xanthine dehydrogenase, molybdopterin binding [Kalmanozyma brasiliensis GHG001]|uniref:Xanthine dehydrogenase/oxidase n=1 Tax=Kalmanozyma brasiliensis (strain GHG001) TaxID=1365824 RepID=V5GG41_KALBG|nr:Aldehyde oxidase/xanthine dehydrogenase, molybdopterin binding [Kalmanozyma brasiliensis GHG001]EST04997.1 Aldehyde oxidase/xanthine dehydrogenase, molybdopterin binding [Kalmanozyma brasiliensis GHG001]
MPVPTATTKEVNGFELPPKFTSIPSKLVFSVNSTRFALSPTKGDDLDLTLLEFIRSKGFTGTKLGCGEGGCGACTVVVGKYDASSSSSKAPYRYKSVNACLLPLVAVHGCHVLTVEGIGSSSNPHPIQERIGKLFGSQCGFCTPGIVMSLYATVRNGYGHLTEEDIEHSLDGCLCRCTGYRPILDAAKSFATVKSTKNGANGSHASSSNSNSEDSDDAEPTTPPEEDLITGTPCAKGADCCMVNGKSKGCAPSTGISTTAHTIQKVLDPAHFKPYDVASELIFPPYLAKDSFDSQDLVFIEEPSETDDPDDTSAPTKPSTARQVWLRPGSLASLVDCMKLYGLTDGGKIRSGNTETGIEVKFKHLKYSVSIFVSDHIKDLAFYRSDERGITVGANLSLSDLVRELKAERPSSSYAQQVKRAILDNLAYFASNQIRNVATLAGNIATASPISDLNPVWVATGAELSYVDTTSGEEKSVNMREFFLGYRKTALPAGAVITKLFVPWSDDAGSVIQAFKQSKRKDDDIAIVNACLRVSVRDDKIIDATLAFGGMGPTTMQSKQVEKLLVGKTFSQPETLSEALQVLAKKDFPLSYGVPGGMPVFRKTLALGFLTRFWGLAAPRLGLPKLATALASLPDLEELATSTVERPVTSGQQDLEDVVIKQPVGDSIPHLSALKQVTGEAVYIDDMPPVANELHAGFVLSQRAHAVLKNIDATEALQMPGVVDFITHKDIPEGGSNKWNPPSMDETFFAEDKVYTVGQIIGIIVADTKRNAQAAAHKVKIEYEDLPHILTIDEAIAAEKFFPPRPVIHRGDSSDEGWAQYDHVLEGETRMGGQEHFYLETNACLVIPGKEDSEIEVISSTQNPSETQVFCASILGIPNNRVVTRVKRLGGGFGGKESRTIAFAAPLTLAAKKLGRPVRVMLDRDEDMLTTGQRHPFLCKWKLAFSASGKLERLHAKVYNNGGWSQDLSQAVLERAMFHIDNCYQIPHLHVEGYICKTNTMSNTAFRGFGGPQGMFFTEDFVTKAAAVLGMRPEQMREANLYQENDETHFKQKLVDWNVPTLWEQLKRSGQLEARTKAVDEFNATHRYRKRGLSMIPTKFGISFTAIFLNQAYGVVHIYHHDGSVLFSHGGTEMGQGLHTKMAQVVATELGIPVSMVHLTETNTAQAANTSATAASASSDLNGMALKNACVQLNESLAKFRQDAAAKGLAGVEAWKDAVHAAYFNRVQLSAIGHYRTPGIGYNWKDGTGLPFYYFTQGVAISEVELDTITGDHRIVRADVHMDIGRSINPSIDVGQIEGAFTQGFGLFTMEETLYMNNGQLATRGPGNYKIPAFLDTPTDMRVSFLKVQDPSNPAVARHNKHLGTIQSSKGIGEPPLFLGSTVFFALKQAISAARVQYDEVQGDALKDSFHLISPATAERIRVAIGDPLVKLAQETTPRKEGEKPFFVSIS